VGVLSRPAGRSFSPGEVRCSLAPTHTAIPTMFGPGINFAASCGDLLQRPLGDSCHSTPLDRGSGPRDRHLAATSEHGRIAWQRSSGHFRRSPVEIAMYRYKTIIGSAPPRSDSALSAVQSKDCMRRSQPDDMARHVSHRPGCMNKRRETKRNGIDFIRAPRRCRSRWDDGRRDLAQSPEPEGSNATEGRGTD
jgi:hypothetical protein